MISTFGFVVRHFAFTCVVRLLSLVATIPLFSAPVFAQFPGGFLEKATSTDVRPTPTQPEIQALLPSRGLFTFPSPYLTQGVRLTNDSDCGGSDCVKYIGYAYWRNINNHSGSDAMLIFVGLDRARGGAGPTLFQYNKVTDEVTNLGPLFDASSAFSWSSGEGWYFSATQPTKLYLNSGPKLLRYDVFTRQFETVFDVSTQPALFGTNRIIWQMHSSNDDRVHSATLKDGATYAALGCFAYDEALKQFYYYPKMGAYDECQIDKSGRWLLIKENVDGISGEDNRIIDLQAGMETVLLDQLGAGGHSDNGFDYLVAADNWNNLPYAIRLWKFGPIPLQPGPVVYYDPSWATQSAQHVSHTNTKAGVPPEQQYACGSGARATNGPRANEIVCFRLDTSYDVLVVAPVMTDMNAPGGGDSYSKLPKGNLDVTGQYFIWTSNMASNRLDAFIVKIPAQLLTGLSSDTTPPAVSMTSPLNGAAVSNFITVSATASDNVEVAGVQFKLDGVNLGSEFTTSPYSISWNTTTATNASHTLTAVARDAAGNLATSSPVAVTVSNDITPPVISSVAAPFITSSGVTITWTTDEPSDTRIEYGLTISYGSSTTLNTTLVTSHSVTLSALAPSTLYHYRVKSRDAAGNLATSADFTFTTLAPPPPDLAVYRTLTPITLDGVLSEWSGAGTARFSGLSNSATAYLLWDATNLYVAFQVTDAQLSAIQTARDAAALYQDDTVEIYLDTRADRTTTMQSDDYQFLVNLNNAQGDLRGTGGGKDPAWNATWLSAVTRQGTLNSHGDTDSGYTVEIAIPWAQIGVTPSIGMYLGMDLAVDDKDAATFDYFDWAGIAPASYAQPNLWKRIQLADAPPDTTPPSVAITSPSPGATVSGTITVSGTAADNVALSRVEVVVDSAAPQTASGTNVWNLTLNTLVLSNGTHAVVARALDAASNTSTASVSVTVSNDTTPPVLSAVTASALTASGATITWTTDEASDTQVEYGLTIAYGSPTTLAPSLVTVHSQTLSGLASSTLYHYRVKSRDSAGNLAISGDFTFTTADGTPPIVSITAPLNGATLSGSITVSASASDNVGVAGVQFQLDGANLGAEDAVAPYSISWNTTTTTNGSHTLTAVARDAVGNTATSAVVTATVANGDTTPPTVSITSPISGSTVKGMIRVSASASDNAGVVGVQFKLDGGDLKAQDTTEPYTVNWKTTTVSNGTHTLTAVARDAAGNASTSAPVIVTVANSDTAVPVISLVSTSNISSSGATIVWTTDEASDSQVEYGPTTAYGSSTLLNTTLVTSHSVALSGLSPTTLYHYRVKSRDAAGNLAISGDFMFTTLATVPVLENVAWTNLVNVTATGNSIQKTGGCDGCADAGATSQQQITSGDGYMEFAASETTALRYAGLNNGNTGTSAAEIKFAIRLQSGFAEVRESGIYKANTSFMTGNVFRIAVESGIVKYYKNGTLFFTSTVAPVYPLLVDSSILSLNGTLTNAVISRGP